jgi:hypothetical protein
MLQPSSATQNSPHVEALSQDLKLNRESPLFDEGPLDAPKESRT